MFYAFIKVNFKIVYNCYICGVKKLLYLWSEKTHNTIKVMKFNLI